MLTTHAVPPGHEMSALPRATSTQQVARDGPEQAHRRRDLVVVEASGNKEQRTDNDQCEGEGSQYVVGPERTTSQEPELNEDHNQRLDARP